jgi:uncharacterized protein HemY
MKHSKTGLGATNHDQLMITMHYCAAAERLTFMKLKHQYRPKLLKLREFIKPLTKRANESLIKQLA